MNCRPDLQFFPLLFLQVVCAYRILSESGYRLVDFQRAYSRPHIICHFHYRCDRRNQSRSIRSGGGGIRTYCRVPHGIQRYAIRIILLQRYNVFIVTAIGATLFLGGWMPFHIGGWSALIISWILSIIYMVLRKNILPEFCNHVVPLNLQIAY